MRFFEYGPNGIEDHQLDTWAEARSPKGEATTLAVIDSGETASYWTTVEIAEPVWAVVYTAFVHSEQGEIWKQVGMVRNSPEKPK